MPSKPSQLTTTPIGVNIRGLLVRAVIVPIVMMGIVAGWLVWQVDRLTHAAGWVDEADRVVAQANEVQKLILDQETALRGFLMTGDSIFLQPYERAQPDRALDELGTLITSASPAASDLAALRGEYHAWRTHAAKAIADPARARDTTTMLARKAEMDAMRSRIASIVESEEVARASHVRQVETETRVTASGSLALLAVLGCVLSIVSRRKLRQVADAYEAALADRAASEAALAKLVEREREARAGAQEALRTKDEFLSTLSHELRTPLTAILGWAGVLRAKKVPPETFARAVIAIERNARAQAQIVDDILDVSRVVSGKFQLRLAAVDVEAVVRAAVQVVRFSAESKGVSLDVVFVDSKLRTLGDADRLQQVVWNLLSNAVKFTPAGRRAEVSVDRDGDRVRIRVSDEGEGISPTFLPHVFERFQQADSSLKRRHGGLGLGLAIVKHLVELHGGDVHAESEGLGRGAVFTILLPIAPSDARLAPEPIPEPSSRPAPTLRGVRVLVVDDDSDSLAVLAAILSENGAIVESAASGDAALAVLGRATIDVIVSDIGMPELDGYELMQRIRATANALPAVALTAYTGPEDVERARLSGFQRHLAKPVTAEDLVDAVARLARASN